ncbi:hypothetical protein [Williamsia serinedens]|uniref:Uncharacterized protein n=1 Tax=Williamsia serinedens TaxID=391736 RepID=A0ABT1H7C8_9NOCA|nr:hypothetical protein [Williamsia serinedens]MCP2163154.1 hypothetical protein [Williamsia serinedens]
MAEGIRTWSDDDGEWAACPYGDEEIATHDHRLSLRIMYGHMERVHPGVEA